MTSPNVSAATRTVRLAAPRVSARAFPALAAWELGFALVAYLSFTNGGYDAVVRDQVGIAVWWLILLRAAIGVAPLSLPRLGWTAVALVAGFAVWTALSTSWSESAERSWIDAAK